MLHDQNPKWRPGQLCRGLPTYPPARRWPPGLARHDWAEARKEVADLMIDPVNGFAPDFKASVIGRVGLPPADQEETHGRIGGHIMHGDMSLDQIWAVRPVLGNGSHRASIKDLYMCGIGAHQGGCASSMRAATRRVMFCVTRQSQGILHCYQANFARDCSCRPHTFGRCFDDRRCRQTKIPSQSAAGCLWGRVWIVFCASDSGARACNHFDLRIGARPSNVALW